MSDLDDQVAALKGRIEDALQRKARAEAQVAVAADRVAQAEQALWSEFGIRPDAVAAFLAAREDDLAAEVRRVPDALERAEASGE